MTLYMLDTNAASEAIRGHPAFDMRLQALAPGQWCISAITCSEIRFGVARRPEAVRLHQIVNEFLRIVPILPWDAEAANRHGALRADLKSRGKPIGDFDEMIAAHALATGAVVVTDNTRHFARVPGLVIENWLRPSADH
ncbi:type II toxin-antitoxin system VapC family toxin [Variovorax sp. J22R133]|uniref:type II toxin-antitoxin system VapC family toxin n=1 Tax=Variovorax brevis TaxID=3053503 RepID=UPI00257650C7|nr:type II toxin-antitoxin system VapC family toxin [Variovorax sp. J22R133]MDM0113490.1 type II toxin-antitoxin system VapC family toxin [Variovorax sp. J22R133]